MRRGITFKGVSSRSLGLTMRTVSWPILPTSTRSMVNIPGLPGSVDFGTDTYLESDATLTFSWSCVNPREALEKGEIISGWLHNDGNYYELTNNDYPDRKYYAKVTSAVPMQIDPCIGSVTVTFTFNPPYPFALDNTAKSPQEAQDRLLWDTATLDGTQYIQTFNANGNMRFTLAGTGINRPVIKLLGYIPANLTLTYGSEQWKYKSNLAYDGIIINCDAETVTKMSDGTNLFANTGPSDYFELSPGQIQIGVSGVSGPWPQSVTIAVDLSPAYAP